MRIVDLFDSLFKSTDTQRLAIMRAGLHYQVGEHEHAMLELLNAQACCKNAEETIEKLRQAIELLQAGRPSSNNQCDGCIRRMPLRDGIHWPEGSDMGDDTLHTLSHTMACTADRYGE